MTVPFCVLLLFFLSFFLSFSFLLVFFVCLFCCCCCVCVCVCVCFGGVTTHLLLAWWNCPSAIHLYVVVVFTCFLFVCFFQLYELSAYKLIACWWAHNDSLYLDFVFNKFLFKLKCLSSRHDRKHSIIIFRAVIGDFFLTPTEHESRSIDLQALILEGWLVPLSVCQ